jgi:NAD-dependent deacetylase
MYGNLADTISSARSLVAFSGAGMSTESGLPDFRSSKGLWAQYDPMALASVHAMENNPGAFLDFYRCRIKALKKVAPNRAHYVLADWEKRGLLKAVITQNVDGLHQEAGSKAVAELHGSLRRARCRKCSHEGSSDLLLHEKSCPLCGGFLRPSVVLFGEALPEEPLNEAQKLTATSDVFIVLGSSLNVSPANLFPVEAVRHKATLIIINQEPTLYDDVASFIVRENLVEVLVHLHRIIFGERGGAL